jgi:hypothetical protein
VNDILLGAIGVVVLVIVAIAMLYLKKH